MLNFPGDGSDHGVGSRNPLRKSIIFPHCHRCLRDRPIRMQFSTRFHQNEGATNGSAQHSDCWSSRGTWTFAGCRKSPTETLKQQIVGAWTLVSWVQTRSDGSKYQRFGEQPKGTNMFSPTGRFSIIIVQPDLPKIASNDPNKPTAEEAQAIVRGSIRVFRVIHRR